MCAVFALPRKPALSGHAHKVLPCIGHHSQNNTHTHAHTLCRATPTRLPALAEQATGCGGPLCPQNTALQAPGVQSAAAVSWRMQSNNPVSETPAGSHCTPGLRGDGSKVANSQAAEAPHCKIRVGRDLEPIRLRGCATLGPKRARADFILWVIGGSMG